MGPAVPPSACTKTMSGALATPLTPIPSSAVDSTTAYTFGTSNHSPTSQNLTTQSLVSITEKERGKERDIDGKREGRKREGGKGRKRENEREREREREFLIYFCLQFSNSTERPEGVCLQLGH